jgi:hypothetical protein
LLTHIASKFDNKMAYEFFDLDITNIIRGDTFDRPFRIGSEFQITGMSVKAQVREMDDSPGAILTFSTTDNSITIDGQVIRLRKAASEMAIAVKTYYYDVQFTSVGGDVTTLFGGKFQLKSDYTR